MNTPLKVTPGEARRLERNLRDKKPKKIKRASEFHSGYELDEVQIWFVAKSIVASHKDLRFCVSLPIDEAIDFLKKQTSKTGAKPT